MTIIDLAKSLGGKAVRRQGAAAPGGASSVRYGTARAASSGGSVTVTLDGSTSPVTLATDADVAQGERVRVVSQGGSYAVVALKGIGSAASAAAQEAADAKARAEALTSEVQDALDKAGDAVVKSTEVESALGDYKVTVSETYQPKGDYATSAQLKSTVEQTASDLTATFTAVVGGRNLLLGTGTPVSTAGNGGTGQHFTVYLYACGGFAKLDPATTYTLGYTVKASAATTGTVRMQQDASPWYWGGSADVFTPTTTATRHTLTFTTPASSTSTATGVQLRMDYIPSTVTVTLSDVQLERGGTATAWTPSPQDTSTLIRQSGQGVEVARKEGGKYAGTRAVLGADALAFTDKSGEVELASFGPDEVAVGTASGSAAIWMCAPTTTGYKGSLAIRRQGKTTLLESDGPMSLMPALQGTDDGLGLQTGMAFISAGEASVWQNPYSATQRTSRASRYDVVAGEVLASNASASAVVAYRLAGWVVVALDNYQPSSEDVTHGTHFSIGTMPDGWKPPAMMKGALYCGNIDAAAMVYVCSEAGASNDGEVAVYTSFLPAGRQLSGCVVYPATR